MTAQITDLHITPVVRHETLVGASGRDYTVRVYRLGDLPAIEGGVYIALDAEGRAMHVGFVDEASPTYNLARIRYAATTIGAVEVALLTPVRYARKVRALTRAHPSGSLNLRVEAGPARPVMGQAWRLEGERLAATDLEAGCLGTIGSAPIARAPVTLAV